MEAFLNELGLVESKPAPFAKGREECVTQRPLTAH